MLGHNHRCSLCGTAETSLPMLKGEERAHCLKCVLRQGSREYQVISFLASPIIKICASYTNFICYNGRFQLRSPDSIGIGFCVVNHAFKDKYQYWPMESLNIQINGQTMWSQRSPSYYVSLDVQREEEKRFIDLKITLEQFPNQTYILAAFEIKRLNITQLIEKDLKSIMGRSKEFVEKKYELEKQSEKESSMAPRSYEFSLRCPIGWNFIRIPVRFRECDHYQPLDYSSLILFLDHFQSTLRCPICLEPTSLESLIIDQYQYKIVSVEVPNLQKLHEPQQSQNMFIYNFSPSNDYTIGELPSPK